MLSLHPTCLNNNYYPFSVSTKQRFDKTKNNVCKRRLHKTKSTTRILKINDRSDNWDNHIELEKTRRVYYIYNE